jgi:PAS domain-containing protein
MVCDRRFRLTYMNRRAERLTRKYGGRRLLGTDLLGCHPPEAQIRLKRILASGRSSVRIQRKGRTAFLTWDSVWTRNGRIGGLVEVHMRLPNRVLEGFQS